MGTHPIFESDFDCLTEINMAEVETPVIAEIPVETPVVAETVVETPVVAETPAETPVVAETPVETPVVAETPVVEEVGTEEVTETEEVIETPAVAAAAAAEEDPQAGGDAEDAAGKQTRAQKKMMKAMSKLNLKHVPGIMKVVMRRKGNILFSIHGGEVYKAPGSDTYIVFGEAQPEDLISSAQREAAKKFKQPEPAKPAVAKIEEEGEEEEEDGEIDTEGVEDKDIELVMAQAGVSKAKAVKALKKNNNDIVNAIMELTM